MKARSKVPLGTGLPTKEELVAYYPAHFTWEQMKTFVNSGDLGLLKRDKSLQKRYAAWASLIKQKYGSVVNYLVNFRLRWGMPDTQSLLASALDDKNLIGSWIDPLSDEAAPREDVGPLPADAPKYFKRDIAGDYLSIIQNDWPYSVPSDVEHTLIWTRIPIFHPETVAESVKSRIHQDGLWGFTGLDGPPPDRYQLPLCLPALAPWGVAIETMVVSPEPSKEEAKLIRRAGEEVHEFVKHRWAENAWETAWFVNPPRLQSVPGLAHVHVFAKPKKSNP